MAFEYLMGFYLLMWQFDKFIANLDRLDDFDYTRLPKVYEEAILFYVFTTRKDVELRAHKISAESNERFHNFFSACRSQSMQDKKKAFDELASGYGDSYLFYCLYRQSGMKK